MADEQTGGITTGVASIIAAAIGAVGFYARKWFDAWIESGKAKDQRLNKLEEDRFNLVIAEWKADRSAANETQKNTADAMKVLATAVDGLKTAIHDELKVKRT